MGAKPACTLDMRAAVSPVSHVLPLSAGEKFGVRGFPTLKWFPRGKADKPEE